MYCLQQLKSSPIIQNRLNKIHILIVSNTNLKYNLNFIQQLKSIDDIKSIFYMMISNPFFSRRGPKLPLMHRSISVTMLVFQSCTCLVCFNLAFVHKYVNVLEKITNWNLKNNIFFFKIWRKDRENWNIKIKREKTQDLCTCSQKFGDISSHFIKV